MPIDRLAMLGRYGGMAADVLRGGSARGSNNVLGIVSMLAAMGFFVIGDAVMKLMSTRLPTGETMFIRGLIGCAVVGGLIVATGVLGDVRRHVRRLILVRAGCDVGASLFFQSALNRLPFAEAGAIGQVNPLIVTAAAALFLGEKVGWRRWSATAVGLVGVLMIIRPGGATFQWASLLVLAATCFSVTRDLITRRLDHDMSNLIVTSFSIVAVTLGSLLLLPFERWVWPAALDVLALTIPAVFMIVGLLLVVISIRSGEVSAVVPFRYSAILWTLCLSAIIWGEVPDRTTLLGIAVLCIAGLYTFHREQVRRREAAITKAARSTP